MKISESLRPLYGDDPDPTFKKLSEAYLRARGVGLRPLYGDEPNLTFKKMLEAYLGGRGVELRNPVGDNRPLRKCQIRIQRGVEVGL